MMPSVAYNIALLFTLCFSLSAVAFPHNFPNVPAKSSKSSVPGGPGGPASPTDIIIETVISGTTTKTRVPITPAPATPPDLVTVISGTTVTLPHTYTVIDGTNVPVPITYTVIDGTSVPVPITYTVIDGTSVPVPITYTVIDGTSVPVPVPIITGPTTIVSGTIVPILTTDIIISGTTIPATYTLTVIDGTTVVVPYTTSVVSGTTYTIPLTPYGVISGTTVPAPSGVITPTGIIPGGPNGGNGGSGDNGGNGPSAPGVDGGGGNGAGTPNVNLGLAIGLPIALGALVALFIGIFWYRRRKRPAGYTPAYGDETGTGGPSGPSDGSGSGGGVPGGPVNSYGNVAPSDNDTYGESGVPGGPGPSSGDVPGGPAKETYGGAPVNPDTLNRGGVPENPTGPQIDMPLEGSHRLSGYDSFNPETSRDISNVLDNDAAKIAAGAALVGAGIGAVNKKNENPDEEKRKSATEKTAPASFQYATSQNPGTTPVTQYGNVSRPISGGEYPSPGIVPGGPSGATSENPVENFELSGNDEPGQGPKQGSDKTGHVASVLGAAAIAGIVASDSKKKKEKAKSPDVTSEAYEEEEETLETKNVDKPKSGLPTTDKTATTTGPLDADGESKVKKQVDKPGLTGTFEEEEIVDEIEQKPVADAPKEQKRSSGLMEWVTGVAEVLTGRPASEKRKSTGSGSGSDVGTRVVTDTGKEQGTGKPQTKSTNVEIEEEEFYEEEIIEGGVTKKIIRKVGTGDSYEEELENKGPSGSQIVAGGVIAAAAIASKKKESRKVRPSVEGVTVYEEEWEAIAEEESSNGTKTASRITRETDQKTVYPVVNSIDVFDDETAAANAAKASKKIYTRVTTRTNKIIYILVPAASASLIKKRGTKTEIDSVTIYSEEWEALDAAQNSDGRKTVTRIVHQTTGRVLYVLVNTEDVFDEEGPASAAAKRTSKIVTKIVESTGKVKYVILPSSAAEACGITIKTTRTIRIVKNNERGEQIGIEEVTIYEDENLANTEASKTPGKIVTRFESTETTRQSFIVLTEQDYFTSEAVAIVEARKQGKVIVKREENGIVRWFILHAPVAKAVGATFISPPAQPKSATRTLRIVKNNEKGEQIGVDEVTIYEDEALATTAATTAGKRVIKLTEAEKTSYLLFSDEEIFDDEASANTAARTQGKVIVRTEITPGVFKYIIIHAPVASNIKVKYITPTRGPTTRTIRIVRTNERNEQIGVDEVVLYDDKTTALKSAGDKTVIQITDATTKKTLYTGIPKNEIFEDENAAFNSEKVQGKEFIQTIDATGQTVYALLHTPVITSLGLSAIKRDSVVSEHPSGVKDSSNMSERDISEFPDVEVEKLTSASANTGSPSKSTAVVDRISSVGNIRSSFESRSSNEGKKSTTYKTGRSFEGVVPENIDVPDLSAYVPPAPTSHVVVSSYYPKLPDEMPLVVGDLIGVERLFEDGWARGQNITQGRRRGLFPLTSVTTIKSGPTQTVAKVGTHGDNINSGRYWLGWAGGSSGGSSGSQPSSPVISEPVSALVVSPSDVAGAAYALAETRSPAGPIPPRGDSLITSGGQTPPKDSHLQSLEDQLPASLPSQ